MRVTWFHFDITYSDHKSQGQEPLCVAEGGGQAMTATHQEDVVMEEWQNLTEGDFSGVVLLMSPSSLWRVPSACENNCSSSILG